MLVKVLAVWGDEDADPIELPAARADLLMYAERMGASPTDGFNIATPDPRDAAAMRDLMLERLRRVSLVGSTSVAEHNCPHVAGFEEGSWVGCNDPQYGLTETGV